MMFPFIKYYRPLLVSSLVLTVVSIALVFIFGLKLGIDFTGGSLLEVRFTGARPATEVIETAIAPLSLGTSLIQQTNDDGVIIKTRFISEDEHQQILLALRKSFENETNKVFEERLETIGPAVGETLRNRSFQAVVAVVLAILLYIAYTFRKISRPVSSWKYGGAAVIALIHDVFLTIGVFVILGKYHGIEVDVAFIVAILTIFGFSVHDTIVVFDRIRENLATEGIRNFAETVNKGINQTLMRSINTSLTALIPLICLFFIGGESIKYFALALVVGITLGTYSSIFVASALLVGWHEWSEKRRTAKA